VTALGVDIGGGSVKVAIDQDGADRVATSDLYQNADPGAIQNAVSQAIERLGDFAHPPASLGLCLPGLLDDAGERIVYAANLPNLCGATIRSLLPDRLRAVTRDVLPDAVATGVGAWLREPVGGRLLVLAMGTGVGAALLSDGQPVTLDGRTAGHIGQIDVSLSGEHETPIGPDAGRGSLEAYVGLPALRARFGDDPAPEIARLGPDDPALLALARAIRICHAIYTPDHLRLAGGVGVMLAPIIDTLRSLVERDLTLVARERWSLACVDDLHLAARGCARLGGQASVA